MKLGWVNTALKAVDSRPARSAKRVRKRYFETLEIYCVCHEGSILSFYVLKIRPVMFADEFTSLKTTRNANFAKIWLKLAFKT